MEIRFQLREAREDEAPLLSDLAARSKGYWPYEASYLELVRAAVHVKPEEIRQWPYVVAETEGRICGFSAAAMVGGEQMLDHLWIEPEFIGQGLGRRLFDAAVRKARALGWRKLLIAADPYAEKFYLKMGAKRVGERESKIRPGFFLPLLEYDLGLVLIGDERVKRVPVVECGEPLVDLAMEFPELVFDLTRWQVQKESKRISLARRVLGEKLLEAQRRLPPGFRLLVRECYRPMAVQRRSWEGYAEFLRRKHPNWSEAEVYEENSKLNAPLDVAPHTTGGAVDLTLTDEAGRVLDLGTEFNASPLLTANATFTDATWITPEARARRLHLMSAMSQAGFVNYPTEWWHWSYGDKYWALVTGAPHALFSSIENEPDAP